MVLRLGIRLRRAALASLWLGTLSWADCGGPEAGPHVVLVSIDTLRADRVGLYGYERGTTPRIDAFFAGGTTFENTTSPAPCTIPAVRQVLSGGFDHVEGRKVLAEHLRDRGYATAAVVSQQQLYRSPEVYRRGFDHFDIQGTDEANGYGGSTRDAREVTNRALAWLADHAAQPKIFLWLHYFDPHDPYEPPQEFRDFDRGNRSEKSGDARSYQRAASPAGQLRPFQDTPVGLFDEEDVAHFRNLYDGEVRYVDHEIGRLLDRFEELDLARRSIVVLLADHGEWLGERERWYHCLGVRDEEIRVPFLMRVNGRALDHSRVSEPVSTLDLLPTLAGLLGIEISDADYDGVDLRDPPENRVVASMWSSQLAVRDAEWKLILEDGTPQFLYWTAKDPQERWNRLGDEARHKQALVERARPYRKLRAAIEEEKIEEALRAIGYIEGARSDSARPVPRE